LNVLKVDEGRITHVLSHTANDENLSTEAQSPQRDDTEQESLRLCDSVAIVGRGNVKILIAEDDPVCRRVLEATLVKWGYEVLVTSDGIEAWQALQGENAPPLAILDWMMPGLDGIDICRKVRAMSSPTPIYIILLTGKSQKEDLVAGLSR